MKFRLDMIASALPVLLAAARREVVTLGPARIAPASNDAANHEDYVGVGDRWGGRGQTYWLRLRFRVPEGWGVTDDERVSLHVMLGAYEDISGPEALAYLDGVPVHGVDYNHREIVLDRVYVDGRPHELALEAYSSLKTGPQTIQVLEIVRVDREADALYHDIRVLHDVVKTMSEDDVVRVRLTHALGDAYNALDLRRPSSDAYLHSVGRARAILRRAREGMSSGGVRPRTVAVGHAHIDLAWLWPVAQTRRKGARTFSTVLALMDRYPDYHFVQSQPALYEMVKEDEPALYERIKARIAEGRWEPSGAAWVEMDCNLAGGEALVRQFLLGQRFYRDELGVESRLLWLPDVFGYSAALPQVLKGCGVDYFMTTKISWNEYNRLPYDTFKWEGIDGTEVLTHMVTSPLNPHEQSRSTQQAFYTYNAKFTPYDVAGNWSAYRQKEVNEELLYLFGFGDGGGGPTAEMQETAQRLRDIPHYIQVEQQSAEQFFRRLDERVWNDPETPRWVGELYLEYHRGTYTSQGWIKKANRQAELLYREAELWSVVADLRGDPTTAERHRQTLTPGWESILFNQFHDILPGSSIREVYDDARVDHQAIKDRGESVRAEAQSDVAASIAGTSGPALLICNPAPFDRADPVEMALDEPDALSGLIDHAGRPMTVQLLEDDRVLVSASAPPLGYAVYSVPSEARARTGAGSEEVDDGDALSIARDVLENRFFRLELDEHAEIASLLDKRNGREVIAPGERGGRLIAFEDRPLNFDAWDINIYYQDKSYPVDDVASWRVVEQGPLRGGVEIVRRYGESTITTRLLLYRDVPRIDFVTHVDWHEHQTLLKVAFPVTVQSPRATFDIQWGNVERPTHWNTSWDWARFETCAHKWADLSQGDYGVALLNDCKYGYDIRGHTLRLSLVKSGVYPDAEADQGEHVFSYALLPHAGDWREGEVVRHAYLFNMPASAILTSPTASASASSQGSAEGGLGRASKSGVEGSGTTPEGADAARASGSAALAPSEGAGKGMTAPLAPFSLVQTDRPGLVIETVKPAEDGDGMLVRCYDAHGSAGSAALVFGREIVFAEEVNMLEEPRGPATYEGRTLTVPVRPYGIASYRVRLALDTSTPPGA